MVAISKTLYFQPQMFSISYHGLHNFCGGCMLVGEYSWMISKRLFFAWLNY